MRYITTTKNLFNQIGAALILNNTSASAAPVNWYSWKGSKIYINRGSSDYGMTFPPITLSAGTYTISAMASMNDINGSGRVVSIGYMDISNNWHNQFVTISSDNQKISYTFTLTEEAVIRSHLQGRGTASNYSNLDTSFWDIQLELGDTATDYVPYGYLPMYKGRYKVSEYCQLVDKSKYPATQTINGVTFTNNGDGSITVNGTAESGSGFRLDTFYIEGNRTYLMIGCPEGGGSGKYFMFDGYSKVGSDLGSGAIKTVSGSDRTLCSPILYVVTGQTVSNLVFKPQLFDLTEMFGAGNEPTTVAEFREKFPNELYLYSPYCWVKMKQMRYKVSDVCQVLDKSKYNPSKTIYGVTFTKNDDGTFTANGTATAVIDYRVVSNNAKINVVVGHKYLMRGCPAGGSKDTYDMRLPFLGFDYGNGLIAKLTDNGTDYYYIQIIVRAGIVCDNLIFKPQLFDLTEMYGAGNEPTTVEEFREKFPNELYPYSPKCYLPLK